MAAIQFTTISSKMKPGDKIYVAGHKGLVGSAICRVLQSKGYGNIVVRTHAELDLLDAQAVDAFFQAERPDFVFLAAAFVGGIMANNTCRADFIYRNLGIQQHVIGSAYKYDVRKLLFLGSTCIYPRDASQPIREDALLTSPLEYTNEPYAIAKIAGLKMCESFNLQYGTNYLAVMPTNLYGPNDNFDLVSAHVLPAMIRKVLLAKFLADGDYRKIRQDSSVRSIPGIDPTSTEEEMADALARFGVYPDRLELWGSGKPLREFLWSEDMAEACVYVMEHIDFQDLYSPETTQVRNCHINIGSGEEVSIADLACLIADAVGYKGAILFDPTKPDGTMRKLTDSSLIRRLGWRHRVALRDGIGRLLDWYKHSVV